MFDNSGVPYMSTIWFDSRAMVNLQLVTSMQKNFVFVIVAAL